MRAPAATRLATRLSFLVAGFGIACWAPLVPFAKARLQIDDGMLGLLLLCIGIGSIIAMVGTGPLSARWGSRPVILAGGFGLASTLPLLPLAGTPAQLAAALLAFGACLGTIDVAMNIHAVEVEQASDTPLMSGFHALFSIGGFFGATVMTGMLSLNLSPFAGAALCAIPMVLAMALAWPRLLRTVQPSDGPLFAWPRGIVLLLSGLAAAVFLAEGAMLDWSALLISSAGLLPASQAGAGYMLFAIAMTAGRLTGDAMIARLGDHTVLFWGGVVAVLGFVVLLLAPYGALAMAGFLLIGLGASNIVPILFSKAGSQSAMPAALAVGSLTTIGYAGILIGPAGIGFVAQFTSLRAAFWMLAGLLILVPLTARLVTGGRRAGAASRPG